jgi:hypothetical protein
VQRTSIDCPGAKKPGKFYDVAARPALEEMT